MIPTFAALFALFDGMQSFCSSSHSPIKSSLLVLKELTFVDWETNKLRTNDSLSSIVNRKVSTGPYVSGNGPFGFWISGPGFVCDNSDLAEGLWNFGVPSYMHFWKSNQKTFMININPVEIMKTKHVTLYTCCSFNNETPLWTLWFPTCDASLASICSTMGSSISDVSKRHDQVIFHYRLKLRP